MAFTLLVKKCCQRNLKFCHFGKNDDGNNCNVNYVNGDDINDYVNGYRDYNNYND